MRYKKVTCFLLLAFVLFGYFGVKGSEMIFKLENKAHFSRSYPKYEHLTLGSIEYMDSIHEIEYKWGEQVALNKIMADVSMYGKDIDTNDYSNNLRLYKMVSHIVYKIGSVDKETHYFRNKLNRAPKTLNALLYLNSRLPLSRRWELISVRNSMYHMQGDNGIYNMKFMSADGFCEAVYNRYGVLLTEKNDPVNMGTFNYAAGIRELNAHEKYDVAPYLKWGNSPDSPQKGVSAIEAGIKQARQLYNKHSTSVTAYRTKIMNSYVIRHA